MRRFIKISLPLLLIALMAFCALDAQAKTKKQPRTVYYVVCGSYSSLKKAIEHSEQMSEVMFYPVYKATANGKTVYRVCCQCYYNKADAEKDLEGLLSGFKGDDWWIWPSKGLAKCVYRPLSPKDGEERIPALKPLSEPLTE
jgi:hypothetical protein